MAPPQTDTGSFGGIVLWGLAAVWAPTVIILLSFAGLLQFRLMYGALSNIFSIRKGGIVWRKVQPVAADFIASLEASLGPATKFSPSLTHVLLTGVILAVFVAGERVAAARRR